MDLRSILIGDMLLVLEQIIKPRVILDPPDRHVRMGVCLALVRCERDQKMEPIFFDMHPNPMAILVMVRVQNTVWSGVSRLREHPDHCSSWQTRDEKRGFLGGAIRVRDEFVFSFTSDFGDIYDEMLVLILALRHNFLSIDEARAIATISGNTPFFNWDRETAVAHL